MSFLSTTEACLSIIIVVAFLSLGFFHYARVALRSMIGPLRPFVLSHVVYARPHRALRCLNSLSRLDMILGLLCFTGTAICNAWDVHSLPQASTRAARLCLVHLIPMFLASGFEFGARLLGISLQRYGVIHGIFGCLATLEALTHVIIIVSTKTVTLSEDVQLYGVLVSDQYHG